MSEDIETIAVMLPPSLGFIAVGPYLPGIAYTLPAAEAHRLMNAKGFVHAPPELPADTEET